MTESDAEKFFKWLDDMERIRDLSDRKVAKRGSFSASMLSTYRKEMKVPTSDFCLKIANGLHADQIETLRQAGYLSTPLNHNPEYEFMRAWFDELTPDQIFLVRTLVLAFLEQNKKK